MLLLKVTDIDVTNITYSMVLKSGKDKDGTIEYKFNVICLSLK